MVASGLRRASLAFSQTAREAVVGLCGVWGYEPRPAKTRALRVGGDSPVPMLSGAARLSQVSQSVLAALVEARLPPRGSAGGPGGKRRTEKERVWRVVVGWAREGCRLGLAVARVRDLIMAEIDVMG
jgi:hypothetical protein